MAKDKRVEVLFDFDEYKRLEYKAQSEHRSVGSVIREAVAQYVTRATQEERSAAVEALLTPDPREEPMPDWEEIKEDIARARYYGTIKSIDYLREEFEREEEERLAKQKPR